MLEGQITKVRRNDPRYLTRKGKRSVLLMSVPFVCMVFAELWFTNHFTLANIDARFSG